MKFYITRQVECAVEIEADSRDEALMKLPKTPEDLVEVAQVAFASLWHVQADGERSDVKAVSDEDIAAMINQPQVSVL